MRVTLIMLSFVSACTPTPAPMEPDAADLLVDTAVAPPRTPIARVTLPPGPFCQGSAQDILKPVSGSLTNPTTQPHLQVSFMKCDGRTFSTTKTCHVRVGSYQPYGVVRTTFTWPQGSSSQTASWDAWLPGDFAAAPCGEEKVFYLTCDEPGAPAHWRQEGPLTVQKVCR